MSQLTRPDLTSPDLSSSSRVTFNLAVATPPHLFQCAAMKNSLNTFTVRVRFHGRCSRPIDQPGVKRFEWSTRVRFLLAGAGYCHERLSTISETACPNFANFSVHVTYVTRDEAKVLSWGMGVEPFPSMGHLGTSRQKIFFWNFTFKSVDFGTFSLLSRACY